MRCPYCGNDDTQVKDSRPTEDSGAIRRRRVCNACGGRFTTFERVQLRDLMVVKKSGRKVPFDREKLSRSINTALRKRSVDPERVERMISGIVRQLESLGDVEITSDQIGEYVMEGLKGLDDVAFVRFASVYKNFSNANDFRAFLAQYLPARPGEMRTPDGQRVGEHQGVMYYTLGQRNGLGIGGRRDASGEPWYVVGKDVTRNVLLVAQGNANRWLASTRLTAGDLSWTAGAPPAAEFACTAKTRYRQDDQACRVLVRGDGVEVRFEAPQRAVTPGQSVVFYAGEECLGGGVIDATEAAFGGLALDAAA